MELAYRLFVPCFFGCFVPRLSYFWLLFPAWSYLWLLFPAFSAFDCCSWFLAFCLLLSVNCTLHSCLSVIVHCLAIIGLLCLCLLSRRISVNGRTRSLGSFPLTHRIVASVNAAPACRVGEGSRRPKTDRVSSGNDCPSCWAEGIIRKRTHRDQKDT